MYALQGPVEENASAMLVEALQLRWHYCIAAEHSFPSTTARYLRSVSEAQHHVDELVHDDKCTIKGKSRTWATFFFHL